MACNKYGDLMMLYMDGILDEFDEMNLKKHIEVCEGCAEDFEAYSEILQSFDLDKMEIIEAPADFAPAVMRKVVELNLYAPKARVADALLFAAWTALIAVLAGGVALAFFGVQFVTWLSEMGLYGIANFVAPVVSVASHIAASIGHFFTSLGYWSHQELILYSFVFLAIFVALVLAQVYLSPKAKLRRVKEEN